MSIINGAQVNVSSGGSLFATATIQVGFSNGTDGTLIVDGLGSSATTPGASAAIWGFGGATANVTFQNNASGSFSQVSLAHSTTAGTAGIVTIQSGADLTLTNNLALAALGGATTSATLSVQGSGSDRDANWRQHADRRPLRYGHGRDQHRHHRQRRDVHHRHGTDHHQQNRHGHHRQRSQHGTLNADGNVTIDGGVLQVGSWE